MMKQDRKATLPLVRAALRNRGMAWSKLCSSATQVILFGSTGCGLSTADSDIDLLCVGAGERVRSRHLDIKWITLEKLQSQQWLHSELASHIASFGKWLHGTDDWSDRVQITSQTLNFKRRLISGRITGLRTRWDLLAPPYRRKHVAKVRRDLQRLALLASGEAVPPTPVLDFFWSLVEDKKQTLLFLAEHAHGKKLLTVEDVDVFGVLVWSSFVPVRPRTFLAQVADWTHNYCFATSSTACPVLTKWLKIAPLKTDRSKRHGFEPQRLDNDVANTKSEREITNVREIG
jgi:predicted nucleotidyltransferase